jgi:protein O-GlcNAc transferase
MAQVTIQQLFEHARQHHEAGRLREAELLYRQILAQNPQHAAALQYLGVIALQAGHKEIAIELIRRAIALNPDDARAHNDLGNALKETGQPDEAIAEYERAIALQPDAAGFHINLGISLAQKGRLDEAIDSFRRATALHPQSAKAHFNLGNALKDRGRLDEAIVSYRQAIALKGDYAAAYTNLGNALAGKEQLDEAIASHRQAIAFNPDLPEAHNNLGNALKDAGNLDEAIACYAQAIALRPKYAEAHFNLGNALKEKGELDEAIIAYRQALALNLALPEAHNNLATALRGKGQLDEAMTAYRRAIELNPGYAEAHNNLGNALKDAGRLDEAIAEYRLAMELKPEYVETHSNLVYALHFHPAYDAAAIFEEHRRWNRLHAEPLAKFIRAHGNSRDPERKIRIGYVSPDFCEHPVGRFILPLLAARDRDRFTVSCYSDVRHADDFTSVLRRHVSQWRNIVGLADERVAELIREDQIDILIDLTMHMADNRMLVFARKPAPVQVTYLAYCSTTGLAAMDYRLTDPHLDPPGNDLAIYSEKTAHLPETYWRYQSDERSGDVGLLPAINTGGITFGCLNNFCKISPDALDVWTQLLQAMPKSRLILHALEGSHRERVRDFCKSRGIEGHRIHFVSKVPLQEYFALHHQIDISLDPFPCNGGTTTCDALWMGVPVVTLAGRTAVGRAGASILRNVGMPELVAETPEQYTQIALHLANDFSRLVELRQTLRARMLASPLMNAARFARNTEAVYRQMWQDWCKEKIGNQG